MKYILYCLEMMLEYDKIKAAKGGIRTDHQAAAQKGRLFGAMEPAPGEKWTCMLTWHK